LVNPATGRGAVSEVFRLRERYEGPCIDELPDLVVQWEGTHPIDALCSERVGRVAGVLPDKRSGAHRIHGFLMARGERIRKTVELASADIVDLAPTILHLQGVEPPSSLEGRVMMDMIEPGAPR
jgi:predicted AlkP superfamily phosphohydrolase/phosphomutase